MKKFKQLDYWISITLILLFLVLSLINMDYTFIIGYLVIGGWQLISMTIHAFNHWFTGKGSIRLAYHWISFFSVLTLPLGSYIILFFTAPVMAIYYTWICYDEVYVKMKQRPLYALK